MFVSGWQRCRKAVGAGGWLVNILFFWTMRYSGGNIPLNLSEGETPLRPSLNSYNSHKFLHSPLKLIQLK